MADDLYRKARNKNAKGLGKFLGELELAVMRVIWDREPATVSDVLETLHQEEGRRLAYTTVMTIMSRLTEKGWLVAEKQGRAFSYRAVHSRQEAEAAAVSSVMRALLEDFGDVVVTQFVKELDDLDPNQLARLAKLADEPEEADDRE
ncbi:MAG: BlaI/MecI/CopY family transcriptional regulator [Anaerolineae bacterium]|nr:BlaI/MecI/CopY family transcriptional regulator [Anaerolineae bacterium]